MGIWVHLLNHEHQAHAQQSCPASAAETLVAATTLESVAPLPPAGVTVAVLNATNRSGLATQVANSLQAHGFTRATPLGNDLQHPPGALRCPGQIRFGPHGVAAARALVQVIPCAQLVNDQRSDDTVDLVLGAGFGGVDLDGPNPARACAGV